MFSNSTIKRLHFDTFKMELTQCQNVKIVVIWGDYGYTRSLAMSVFDRVHTTSYAPLSNINIAQWQ